MVALLCGPDPPHPLFRPRCCLSHLLHHGRVLPSAVRPPRPLTLLVLQGGIIAASVSQTLQHCLAREGVGGGFFRFAPERCNRPPGIGAMARCGAAAVRAALKGTPGEGAGGCAAIISSSAAASRLGERERGSPDGCTHGREWTARGDAEAESRRCRERRERGGGGK